MTRRTRAALACGLLLGLLAPLAPRRWPDRGPPRPASDHRPAAPGARALLHRDLQRPGEAVAQEGRPRPAAARRDRRRRDRAAGDGQQGAARRRPPPAAGLPHLPLQRVPARPVRSREPPRSSTVRGSSTSAKPAARRCSDPPSSAGAAQAPRRSPRSTSPASRCASAGPAGLLHVFNNHAVPSVQDRDGRPNWDHRRRIALYRKHMLALKALVSRLRAPGEGVFVTGDLNVNFRRRPGRAGPAVPLRGRWARSTSGPATRRWVCPGAGRTCVARGRTGG